MIGTKSHGYSNSGQLSEGKYSMPLTTPQKSKTSELMQCKLLKLYYYIPRRKSGIYWIQVRRAAAAAAVEISLWTR